jgi:hypothetical protein
MWYMHDGATSHVSRAVRDVLNNIYHNRWIGREGPTAWPPRSPDLSTLYFYLWEHLKTLVDNKQALHSVVEACQTIRNYPGIFPGRDVSRRELNLMEDKLSTYYECTLSSVAHKLNISGHMLIRAFCLALICGAMLQTGRSLVRIPDEVDFFQFT